MEQNLIGSLWCLIRFGQPHAYRSLQLSFCICCAPGSVLGGYFDRANAVVFDSPDDTVNAALRRILKGQRARPLSQFAQMV